MAEKNLIQQTWGTAEVVHHDRAILATLPSPVVILKPDDTVVYVNPAFEAIFEWTLPEVKGKLLPFIPDALLERDRHDTRQLVEGQVHYSIETTRLTKSGRVLDVAIDSALVHDEAQKPAGRILLLRDITTEKQATRINQALFRIFEKLHHFQELDELLEFITREVQALLNVGGAMVILLDEERKEFFFRVAALDDSESGNKMKEVRFPMDKGVAGYVYRTGEPVIVPDTSQSPHFFKQVDDDARYHTRSMLDVPIATRDRRIGVLCVVNKKETEFTVADVDILSTIAGTIALPLENARMNEQLKQSYEDVKRLNSAKDRVIHHLSHELKTPLSVAAASLTLLERRLAESKEEQKYKRILDRAQRNLRRILDMQYEIEDFLREKEYTDYHILSMLLDACVDELDVLITDELGEWSLMQRVRIRIEELFGPRESVSRKIRLDQFVERQFERLRPHFAHRQCRIGVQIKSTPIIMIPPDVLEKVVEGLLRNAIENTPDGSKIDVTVRNGPEGPELEVKDFGVGIIEENQRLIFENYFPAYDTEHYSSRKPYDFRAGGKGFDLLRMKIFSERYHFTIRLFSHRCGYIPHDKHVCPGDIAHCVYCRRNTDCLLAGGTTVIVQFPPVSRNWTTHYERI